MFKATLDCVVNEQAVQFSGFGSSAEMAEVSIIRQVEELRGDLAQSGIVIYSADVLDGDWNHCKVGG